MNHKVNPKLIQLCDIWKINDNDGYMKHIQLYQGDMEVLLWSHLDTSWFYLENKVYTYMITGRYEV